MSDPVGVLAWRCAVCGTTVDIATPYVFRCPRSSPADHRHVLHPVTTPTAPAPLEDPNPVVAFGPRMAWWAFAAAHGMTEAARIALAREVARGFAVTPLVRHWIPVGGRDVAVWIKDETGNVGGSHKSRHLVGALLHLRAAAALGLAPDRTTAPLAIASCGNAAIAAATLAQQAEWPLQVFVPEWASPTVLSMLEGVGASITVCARREADPPGDPAILRFRESVAAGALPFTVQGPENATCLDAGRTIGWEMAEAFGDADGSGRLDRTVVQVGGGALATCVGWGLGPGVRLDSVQAQGCAPLARAWWRSQDLGLPPSRIPQRWIELMTAWERPQSVADGIMDDETYDWLGVFEVMQASGGRPLVAPEEAIVEAASLGAATGIPVSHTGAAGLAGLLVPEGAAAEGEQVAVVFSGVAL
ncbi:MAG: PLP-dependent lyase/thiolase [Aldersonia sp.]|nr:PLP-dependent lyase/thiolase [Aldersonia sp.]